VAVSAGPSPAAGGIEVRQVGPDEWHEFRRIRLAALADAPTAFSTRLADAERLPDSFWIERTSVERAGTGPLFAAVDGTEWVGIVGGHTERGEAHLISLWVDPRARRRGAAAALVEAVSAWARDRGHRELRLWVTETNAAARRCYETRGFAYTGRVTPYEPDVNVQELEMSRRLPPG
jgi:ribosomal protein S18 acetylase RimI-like enzyme